MTLAQDFPFSIQLFFSSDDEAVLRKLIGELRRADVLNTEYIGPEYRPHVSLSVHRIVERRFSVEVAHALAEKYGSMDVTFPFVGMFNAEIAALFLGVHSCSALRVIHRDLMSRVQDAGETCWHYYLPEHWVPHCALLIDDDRARCASGLELVAGAMPNRGRLTTIGVCGFEEVIEFELRGASAA